MMIEGIVPGAQADGGYTPWTMCCRDSIVRAMFVELYVCFITSHEAEVDKITGSKSNVHPRASGGEISILREMLVR